MGINVNFSPSVKQWRAYKLLTDNVTTHIGYGGSARSGKSYLMCYWLLIMSLAYPKTRWGLARKELKTLRKTTFNTLLKVFAESGLKNRVDYTYNGQDHIIKFSNGSEIVLIDTAYQPSDPLYTRFGGLELTGCAIDESNESEYLAVEILFSRCGWCLNEKYGLKKKLIETFNPDKGHVYRRYWKPFRDGNEDDYKKFIRALPQDNPDPAVKEWIEDFKKTADKVSIERLIFGNFDYDDDPSCLIDYDAIQDAFTNDFVESGERYLSSDLAMKGRDLFVCGLWSGLRVEFPVVMDKSSGKEIEETLRNLANKHSVPRSKIICDSDGLGNYLESYFTGIKEFRGGHRATESNKYVNKRSECLYKLAEKVNKREIKIICNDSSTIDRISEELQVIKAANIDKDDKKKAVISKDQIKDLIGRSPDFLDVLMMRMDFETSGQVGPVDLDF